VCRVGDEGHLEIVFGMGEMLGHFHWRAGYDARDVEFVMGGASFSGVALFVIDFNQVCYSMSLYILTTNALLDARLEKDQRRNTDPCRGLFHQRPILPSTRSK
jgi:hypothetical protein